MESWSSMREMRGETTSVIPGRRREGSWYISDLPLPVACARGEGGRGWERVGDGEIGWRKGGRRKEKKRRRVKERVGERGLKKKGLEDTSKV